MRIKRSFRLLYELEKPRLFLLIALFSIIALLIWMSQAEIAQVVRVEGKMIPAGRSQQIQHFEGGIISKIAVQEGDIIRKGDLLLIIDRTLAGANLSETKIKLNSERAHAVRLQAEVDGAKELVFPEDLADSPVTEAEKRLFRARSDKLDQTISVHNSLLAQRMAEYREAKERQGRLTTEMKTASDRLDIILGMAKNGSASRLEVLDARSRLESIKTQLGEVAGVFPKLDAAIAEEKARIESERSIFRADAQNELVASLQEIERLKQISTAATDRLTRTDVRAPVDGVVNSVSVNTVGGVIKPGENLVEITPTTESILIEARAHPRDRGDLRPGLRSEIRVSAYDTAKLGFLEGHVTKVGADSVLDSRNEPYYQVNIVVDSLPDLYKDRKMVPGMTVTADIVTGQRTILAYLLSPLRKFSYNIFRDPR